MSEDGKSLLFEREYSEWGEKLNVWGDRDFEKKIPFAFAGLIQLPSFNGEILQSETRIYLPSLGIWQEADNLIKWNPESLVNAPGSWSPLAYAGNDPVNFVDPSGNASFSANYSNRNRMNDTFITKGVKTTTSLVIGAAYNNAARTTLGLGAGVGELIKNNFRLTVLGTVAGSVGATALNMGVKTVLVGTAFTIGQKIGNVFGATIDTLVDNAQGSANDFFSKMMNRAGATDLLHDVGFGSGSPNFDFRRHSNSSSSVFWNSNPYLIKN